MMVKAGIHHEFEPPGILPVRPVERFGVGGAEIPGEGEDRDDRRHHDRKHDRDRIDQNHLVGGGDRALRIEDVHRRGFRLPSCGFKPSAAL
jgi:hypothetical protein